MPTRLNSRSLINVLPNLQPPSEVFRLGDIFNEATRGHYQSGATLRMVGRTPARAPFSHCAHGFDAALYNGNSGSARRASLGEYPMTEDEKEMAKATAAAGVGAGVGTAGGEIGRA